MPVHLLGYLWCALAALASAGATLLIKHATIVAPAWGLPRLLWLGAACGVYGLGFLCYSVALQKLPMSLAYPVMTAVSMLVIALLGYTLLQEPITLQKAAGMALLAAGAFLLTR